MVPLISVMMPAYNAEAFVGQAIESVLAQTMADWELVVVDDGSSDGTAAVVERFANPRIKLVRQINGGESTARNTAMRHMQGELMAFLDADDQWLPEHLALTSDHLTRHPERDAVYTDGFHVDTHGVRLRTLSSRRSGPFEGDLFEPSVRASDVFGPPICVVLRRRGVVERDLTFDPEIVIGPDWDFLTRYAEAARFGYIAQPTCLYRVHQTNITVQTGWPRRALSMARCREKGIGLKRFGGCSLETRQAAFYDLLVNLLTGHPERQTAVCAGHEFQALPAHTRSYLLHMMAARSITSGAYHDKVGDWLRLARELDPANRRVVLVGAVYAASPRASRLLLRVRRTGQIEPSQVDPLGDVIA